MISDKELLTPERLVRSGREILYEAVNTGRLVAFVGSGVSLVYGQPTWNEFIDKLRGKLDSAIKKAESNGDLSSAEAGRMRAMVKVTQIKDSDDLVTLELIRRAYAQIEKNAARTSDSSQYRSDLQSLFIFNAIAQDLITRRLIDAQIPDIENISKTGKYPLDIIYNTQLLAALAEIRNNAKLKMLANELRGEPSRLTKALPPDRDRALPIDRRSSLAIFLALCAGSPAEMRVALSAAIAIYGPHRSNMRISSRPLLDPIREMDEWLRLRRYVSTNYDLGLEDQHMVAPDANPLAPENLSRPGIEISRDDHSIMCQHRDGRVVRSDVNDGLHVAPLFDFALGGVDNSVHIYHLHGRIDRPETMIAADSEYNRLYRSESGTRTAFDHAYDTLIVGNPILFVGSGMTEAELTRVLRANVSNPDVLRAAPSIVLRAADKPQRELILDQTQLATKLGVRVVYTGHARRGAAYTLRDHLLLIDYVAYRYGLVGRKNREKVEFKDPPFRYRTKDPTFDAHSLPVDCESPDQKLEEIKSIISARFRLLWDLDYERKVIAWLIAFAPDTMPTTDYSGSDRLIADYLNMLVQKLTSAALRHELRQVGHESFEYYRERSIDISARVSIASCESQFLTRHVSSIRTLKLPGPDPAVSTDPIFVANHIAGLGNQALQNLSEITNFGALFQPSDDPHRTIVLGARGIGKGRLLADFAKSERPEGNAHGSPRHLVINCCYGQEIDSIVSIVDQFLGSSVPNQSNVALSRRERFLSTHHNETSPRPRIVLGGVDRLFGTDGMPMSVEFEWLLDQLLRLDRKIDLLVTGELRCLEYFRSWINRQKEAQKSTAAGDGAAPSVAAHLWVITPKGGPEEVGLRAKLSRIAEVAHRPHYLKSNRETRLNMAHGAREADQLIGDWLDTLETGKAQLPGCTADDPLALEIVKVCAFIGLPFEADVLVSVPAIQRRLIEISGKSQPVSAEQARARLIGDAAKIRDALARTMQLGLVNIVEPFGEIADLEAPSSDGDWEACKDLANSVIETGRRLVVHRLISMVIKDRFGVPNSANVLSDSYNLSLYAVQPDDASVPEPRVTGELEELIDHLMNAWKETDLCIERENGNRVDLRWLFRETRKGLTEEYDHDLSVHYLEALRNMRRRLSFASPLPVIGLRAAGGVIRGYYSAVNLFGLDLGDQRRASGKVSAISDHKQRIRLLLNLTIEAQEWGGRGHSTLFHEIRSSLDTVPGIVTEDSGDEDGQLQSLKRAETIALLYKSAGKSSIWNRSAPNAMTNFYAETQDTDGKPVEVTGLRTRLNLKETNPPSPAPIRPFFDGEIVWLLNERAMLAMAQGDLYTASTTFDLAFKANQKIEGDRYHPSRARLTVNRAFLWIERGKIADARQELETLRQHLDGDKDAIGSGTSEGMLIAALCDGYLGLCNHLFGMLKEAEDLYDRAISAFSAMRQQRAIAIFEHHRCALLRQIPGRETDADSALQRGIAAATGGRHTDILYRLRIAKAHHEFCAGKISPDIVIATLGRAIDYGLSLEMHRVAVEALTARAHVHLNFGDIEAASRDVSRAAAKAAQNGMTLRRIWLRVMTGQVYRLRDDSRNARMILERAVSEGSHIGYQRAVEVATRQLINLKMR